MTGCVSLHRDRRYLVNFYFRSLPAQPAYLNLRVCAQNCINFSLDGGYLNDNTADLAVALNCGGPIQYRKCLHLPFGLDQQRLKLSYIVRIKRSSDSVDASTAAALYVSYCDALTTLASSSTGYYRLAYTNSPSC